MNAEPAREVAHLLDEPATWLLAAGTAEPLGTAPVVRLHCLQAVEYLRVAGARPDRVLAPLRADEAASRIRDAHRSLCSLPVDLLVDPLVHEAIREVRAALEALG